MFTYVTYELQADDGGQRFCVPLERTIEIRNGRWFCTRVREIHNPQGHFRRQAYWLHGGDVPGEDAPEDEGLRTWQLYSAWHAASAPDTIDERTKPYSIRFYEQPEELALRHGPAAVADMATRTDNRWFP